MREASRHSTASIRVVLISLALLRHAMGGEVIRNGSGTVEFLGLETKTAQQIHEQLGGKDGSAVHYCAADLLAKTDLAAASVVVHFLDKERYSVATVLEKTRTQDAQLRVAPSGDPAIGVQFKELADALGRDESLRNAVLLFGAQRLTCSPTALSTELEQTYGAEPPIGPLFAQMDRLRSGADAVAAVTASTTTCPTPIRRAAIAALENFAERDESWRALLVACIDSDESVREDARTALFGLLRSGTRRVDWKPVRKEIEAILAGSNLWALPVTIEILARTQIDAELARNVIGAQPRLIMEHIAARLDATNGPARSLAAIAAGRDFGDDIESWRKFVDSLRTTSQAPSPHEGAESGH